MAVGKFNDRLFVIMPAYNESACIERVIQEWQQAFDLISPTYTLCVLDDGSKDGTLQVLEKLARANPKIMVLSKPNSGHGSTCLFGYQKALSEGSDWILQLDSDGQCDPIYWKEFWNDRVNNLAVLGKRVKRDDSFSRLISSRILSLVCFIAVGSWPADANVPYRLMRRDLVEGCIARIPEDFFLANVFLTMLLLKKSRIRWVSIRFRQRMAGESTVKFETLVKHARNLFIQLRAARRAGIL